MPEDVTFKGEIQRSYADFCYLPDMQLKWMGYNFVNTPKSSWKKFLMRVYFGICFLSYLYNVYYMLKRIYEWDTIGRDPRIIMRYAELFFFMLNSFVKFSTFQYGKEEVRRLYKQLEEIYPKTDKERAAYQVNKYYWPRLVHYILIFYYIVIWMMVFGPIVQSICMYLFELYRFGIDKAKFPYLRCYPFKYSFDSFSASHYVLTSILEITFSFYIVFTHMGTDLWTTFLVMQICMQLDHIAKTLANYKPSEATTAADCRFLKKLILRHNYLLSLNRKVDRLFGVLLIYNLLMTALLLCCVAFYAIIQGFNMEAISYLLFLLPASGQFYIICYYGQLLITTSQNIAQAAYEHSWYNASLTYKKMLIILIGNAQRPATLSARGFMVISLETFMILINLTYRFFAVVRTTMKKN